MNIGVNVKLTSLDELSRITSKNQIQNNEPCVRQNVHMNINVNNPYTTMTTDNINELTVTELNSILAENIRHVDAKGNYVLVITAANTHVFKKPSPEVWTEILETQLATVLDTMTEDGVVEISVKNRPIHWYTKNQEILTHCENAPSIPTRCANRARTTAATRILWDTHDKGWRVVPLADVVSMTLVLVKDLYKGLHDKLQEAVQQGEEAVGE